ncbi:hypothetical protein [Microbacterium lushaniae]|uniref:Uncharacterized protein n=1 Tax=Microbacterium lushaniae TaxID=2614639 RepID=A0A5J6L836_9MICO|nr:hypothetical protein [Microbacterium lushaniae]QEW04643.1 hypothetical protein F6J85_17160 [Microbacterium lushaniae]
MRGRSSAAEIAAELSKAVARGNGRLAYRLLIQLADDLRAVDAAGRVVLAAEEPPNVGRWSDAIAGIVELRLREAGAPLPDWVVASIGDPNDLWEPDRGVKLPWGADLKLVPEPLSRRGVAIEASELESV